MLPQPMRNPSERETGSDRRQLGSASDRGRRPPRRTIEVVLRLLWREGLGTLSRKPEVTAAAMALERDQSLGGGQTALRSRTTDERDQQIGRMKTKTREITMKNELLPEWGTNRGFRHQAAGAASRGAGATASQRTCTTPSSIPEED